MHETHEGRGGGRLLRSAAGLAAVLTLALSPASLAGKGGGGKPGGGGGSEDTTPPSAVMDLEAVPGPTTESITLTWTAPSDDTGVTAYDVRYLAAEVGELTEATWAQALQPCYPIGSPSAPGTLESAVVQRVWPGTAYWIGLKSRDAVGNWSALSEALASPVVTDVGDWRFSLVSAGGAEYTQLAYPAPGGSDEPSIVFNTTWQVNDLHYAYRVGSTWTIEDLDAASPFFDFKLDDAGDPWVAFLSGTSAGLAHRQDGTWTVDAAIDTWGDSGEGSVSLAFDGAGQPAVAWLAPVRHRGSWRRELRVARPDGSGGWSSSGTLATYSESGPRVTLAFEPQSGEFWIGVTAGGLMELDRWDGATFLRGDAFPAAENTRNVARDMALLDGPSGPVAGFVYARYTALDYRYVEWSEASGWTGDTLLDAGPVVSFPTVAAGPDGEPAVLLQVSDGEPGPCDMEWRLVRRQAGAWSAPQAIPEVGYMWTNAFAIHPTTSRPAFAPRWRGSLACVEQVGSP